MLTKADFLQAVDADIDNYPAIAPLYRAGDPRILQQIGAQATMLAMLSAQLETAQDEPFEKVRDSTILADAAMRGIVPKATPPRIRVTASNKNASAYVVETGRMVLDSAGLLWRLESGATIPAGEVAEVEAVQQTLQTITHIVSGSRPFYEIEIPEPDDGAHLVGIAVSDDDGAYEYRVRYTNAWPGERIFHVEADDRQRVYVRFGLGDVVGTQPEDGRTLTISVMRTAGEASPAAGSPLTFEYLQTPNDSQVEFAMSSLLLEGQAPIDIATLRDLCRYPSVYDDNAVFLGEFDYLVRRKFQTLRFLSVWNESAEERARGASVDHINVLFVACLAHDQAETTLTEADPAAPVAPTVIADGDLTQTQRSIRSAIASADDSYKVRFYTPVRSKISVTIQATVASSYVASDVRGKIIEAVLGQYGEAATASRRGYNKPLYQNVYALLKARIPALTTGKADFTVVIEAPNAIAERPEMWRYVAEDSLTVTVATTNVMTTAWGGG